MQEKIEKLKDEIERLEEAIEKDHFGGLLDRQRSDKNYNRLKKLRRELRKLEDEKKATKTKK